MESYVERNHGQFDEELISLTKEDVEISEQVEQSPSHYPTSPIAGPSSGGCGVTRKRKSPFMSGTFKISAVSSSFQFASSSGASTPSDEGADDNDVANAIDFLEEESNCALEQAADKREECVEEIVDDETVEKSFGFKFNEQDGYFYCLYCQERFLFKQNMKKHLYIESSYHTHLCTFCGFKAYNSADATKHKKVCEHPQLVKMVKLTLFEENVENILNVAFKAQQEYFQKVLGKKSNAAKRRPFPKVMPLKKAKKKDSVKRPSTASSDLEEEGNCALEQVADKREEIGVDDETAEKSFGFKFNERDSYFYCLNCQKRFLVKHSMRKHLYIESRYHTELCINCGFKAYNSTDAARHKKGCKDAQFVKMVKLTHIEENVENILNAVFKTKQEYFRKVFLAKKRNATKRHFPEVTPVKKAKKKKDSVKRAIIAAKPLDRINEKVVEKKADGQWPSLDEPSALEDENHLSADDDDVSLIYDENMIIVPGFMDGVDMVDEGDLEEKEKIADLYANNAPKLEQNVIGSEENTFGSMQGRKSPLWRLKAVPPQNVPVYECREHSFFTKNVQSLMNHKKNYHGDGCERYSSSQDSPFSPSSVASSSFSSCSSSQSSPFIRVYKVVSSGKSSVGSSKGSLGSSASKPAGPSGVILHPGRSAFERGGLNSIPIAQQTFVPTTLIKVKPTLVSLTTAGGRSVVKKALFQCKKCSLIYENVPKLTAHMVKAHDLQGQSKVKVKSQTQPLPPPPPQPQLPFYGSFPIGSWQRRVGLVSPTVREEDGFAVASFSGQNWGLSNFTPKEDCKHCEKRNADAAHIRQCFIRYSCPFCLQSTHDDIKVVIEHLIVAHNDLWKYGVKIFSKLLVTTPMHRKIQISKEQWKNAIKDFDIPLLNYLLQIENKHNVANKVIRMEMMRKRAMFAAAARAASSSTVQAAARASSSSTIQAAAAVRASSSSTIQAAAPQMMEDVVDLTLED